MSRQSQVRRLLVLVVVGMLVASAAGIAAGDYTAPPSPDTSTTDDTATTTDIQTDTSIDNVTGNASENETLQYVSDSNDTAVELRRNDADNVFYDDQSPTQALWNNTDNDGHFNATVSHDSYLLAEHAPGENVRVNATMINNTSAADPAEGFTEYWVNYTNDTATEAVTDSEADSASFLTVKNDSTTVFGLSIPGLGADQSTIQDRTVDVNGSNTTVYVAMHNSTVNGHFSEASADASSGDKLSRLAATDRNFVIVSDGTTTRAATLYSGSAPSDADGTYAVQRTINGVEVLEIHLGSDYSGAANVDVTAVGNAGIIAFATQYVPTAAGDELNALGLTIAMAGMGAGATGAVTLGLAGAVARRRQEV